MSTTVPQIAAATTRLSTHVTTDADFDERSHIKCSILATWILALIVLSLRFAARKISKAGFWWDDWLLVLAMVRMRAAKHTIY